MKFIDKPPAEKDFRPAKNRQPGYIHFRLQLL